MSDANEENLKRIEEVADRVDFILDQSELDCWDQLKVVGSVYFCAFYKLSSKKERKSFIQREMTFLTNLCEKYDKILEENEK